MFSAPIGMFDSGVGGLSVMREVKALLPAEDIIYYADTAYCPYGQKTTAEIQARCFHIADFLLTKGAKMIIVACNTASIAALDAMRQRYAVPIVGMEPAVKPASRISKSGKIGVMATGVTIAGERFSSLVERFGSDVEVFNQPCPGLVEHVEAGRVEGPEVEALLQKYLAPMLEFGVDAIVLGCTHYPFLRNAVEKIAGPHVAVIDTGAAVARQAAKILGEHGLVNGNAVAVGQNIYFASGEPAAVKPVIRRLMEDASAAVHREPEQQQCTTSKSNE
ncbi:MAG TPA: glutamate racemase [Firmicutes bacterium]|jgi:glutamate racemase|nr:glutamate racemase [Bacillota bacterium]